LVLGTTDPFGTVTLFDAKELSNTPEEITLVHEKLHQGLFLRTTVGHLTNYLWMFAQAGQHKDECELFFRDQETIQELNAYYGCLSLSARHSPAQYEATWSKTLQQYRSVIEPVLGVLPLKGVSDAKQLHARALVVEAVARSAFNSDCLESFSDPAHLSADAVRKYLRLESTLLRFLTIFNSLIANAGLDALEGQLLEVLAAFQPGKGGANAGLKWLMEKIPSIVSPDVFVANAPQIVSQLVQFVERWQKRAQEFGVKLAMPRPSVPPPKIVKSPDYIRRVGERIPTPQELNKEFLDLLFGIAPADQPEIYLWIYMKDLDEAFLTVFFCGLDSDGGPRADSVARFNAGSDVVEGVMKIEDVFRALDRAPRGSIIGIFYQFSWALWNCASKNRTFAAFAKTGCIEVDLTPESVGLLLTFQGLQKDSSWFGSNFGEGLLMAYFVSSKRPEVFAILRLRSMVAVNVFTELMEERKIPKATADLHKHKRMLEVASLPVILEQLRRMNVAHLLHH
jgi:hypothetical protein